jgi:predicted tellurium resistance membrane protein TerC
MINRLFTPDGLLGLTCLAVMLILTGARYLQPAQNMIGRWDKHSQPAVWWSWAAAGLLFRVLFLGLFLWLLGLRPPLFSLFGNAVQLREIVYLALGFFLLSRTVIQINLAAHGNRQAMPEPPATSIAALLGSVIPAAADAAIIALGMTDLTIVMVAGIFLGSILLVGFRGPIIRVVRAYPMINTLAVAFLTIISVLLFIEGIAGPALKISKTYLYFAMAFGFAVQLLSIRYRSSRRAL